MNPHIPSFLALMRHPLKFRFFLFWNLPSAFFSGLRISEITENACSVTVPYKWFSKNPFRSIYFACLAMAAEMSTGVLALAQVYKIKPVVSILVIRLEAQYLKKATGITTFRCMDGEGIRQAIDTAIQTGKAQTFVAKTVGTNAAGEQVAEFSITWSFRQKTS